MSYLIRLTVVALLFSSLSCRVNDEREITIEASTTGRFGIGRSWSLSVDASRNATLTIKTNAQTVRKFRVSEAQIEALKAMLEQQKFFALADHYGQSVPDGSETRIAVTWGDQSADVRLRYLMNWVKSEPERLKEPARALRVLAVVRNWFSDSEAVDLRRYDQIVLDAVE